MPRKPDYMYKWFTFVGEVRIESGFAKEHICNFCDTHLFANTFRKREHLCGCYLNVITPDNPSHYEVGTYLLAHKLITKEEMERKIDRVRQKNSDRPITTMISRMAAKDTEIIHSHLAKAFTSGNIAFRVLDDPNFRAALHALNPAYSIPSRKAMAGELLDKEFSATQEKVQNRVKEAEFIALTTDEW